MYTEIRELFRNKPKRFKDTLGQSIKQYRIDNSNEAFRVIIAASYEMVNKALARYNPMAIRNLSSYEVYDVVIDAIMEATELLDIDSENVYKDYCRLLWTVLRNKLLNLMRLYFADKRNAIIDGEPVEEHSETNVMCDDAQEVYSNFKEGFVDTLTSGEFTIYVHMLSYPTVFAYLLKIHDVSPLALTLSGLNVINFRSFVTKASKYARED